MFRLLFKFPLDSFQALVMFILVFLIGSCFGAVLCSFSVLFKLLFVFLAWYFQVFSMLLFSILRLVYVYVLCKVKFIIFLSFSYIIFMLFVFYYVRLVLCFFLGQRQVLFSFFCFFIFFPSSCQALVLFLVRFFLGSCLDFVQVIFG